ncbi:MAG TPA: LLM class flavin-dependent oxidoreductase [Myxococcota bacterium]|nr:LLM class flavin-dependent oxidoreductase [Myxococcota bacterium]
MKYGLYLPNFADFGDARVLVELAQLAEESGWDGFFLWDHIARPGAPPVVDPWVALAAVAMATRRMRIGALVTPLARRRPWKVARETVSLDRLSGGRLVFGAGLGSPGGAESEWAAFGEEADLRVRAEMLDEALEVLASLWSGEPFSHSGRHFPVRQAAFRPTALQSPRIPVWIAGYWPSRAPLRRAARWDGVFPLFRDGPPHDVAQLREAVELVQSRRAPGAGPFDVVYCGEHAGGPEPYARAGATWWLARVAPDASLARTRSLIAAGPPGS